LLTEWTLKAGRHFKAASVFLIKKGACAAVEDIALCRGAEEALSRA